MFAKIIKYTAATVMAGAGGAAWLTDLVNIIPGPPWLGLIIMTALGGGGMVAIILALLNFQFSPKRIKKWKEKYLKSMRRTGVKFGTFLTAWGNKEKYTKAIWESGIEPLLQSFSFVFEGFGEFGSGMNEGLDSDD